MVCDVKPRTNGLFIQRQFVYGVRLRANLLITLRGFYGRLETEADEKIDEKQKWSHTRRTISEKNRLKSQRFFNVFKLAQKSQSLPVDLMASFIYTKKQIQFLNTETSIFVTPSKFLLLLYLMGYFYKAHVKALKEPIHSIHFVPEFACQF